MTAQVRWTRVVACFALVVGGCGGESGADPNRAGAGNAGAASGATSVMTGGNSGSSGSASSGTGGVPPSAGGGGQGGSSAGSSAAAGNAGTGGDTMAAGGGGGALAGAGPAAGASGAAAGTAGSGGMGGTSGSAGSAGSNAAGGAITGEATERAIASLPADRQEHSVAAANGEVFVLGGYAPNATAGVIAYNPENDSWRNVADFIGPFNHANAASVGEKLYVAGFYEAGTMSQASAQTFVYDPVADDWSELAPMPADTNRAASCVAVLGTRIYIFGGARDNAVVADASYYDTAADSWTELPPLPEAREHCTAGAIGEKLYVGGGRTHTITQLLPKTWEFDPVAETYLEKAAILTPRGGSAGAVLGGRLFVFGGEGNPDSQAGVFGEIEGYDPVTDSWESFAPLAVPRHGFGAAVLDGRIYLPGGANRQGGAAHDAASVFFFE